MGRSQETFGKKDREKKRIKKREEKALRKQQRKENASSGKFEDMLAYVDENGQIVDTPPDESKKKKIKAESINLDYSKIESEPTDSLLNGKVTFFNDEKGYGFIKDLDSNESYFVHVNKINGEIHEGDKVSFEIEKGPKGFVASNVTKI
ncbi:MAG: DNA-binding protein [Flavobacteriales bacterium]|nr:DNA-binding protein [Flavobacteriales bacterium]|tara:strand:- start:6127 stop:6573 length:447 start_codon:yes stop_codon:yes gene_type:complete